jgi:hypothetical protein
MEGVMPIILEQNEGTDNLNYFDYPDPRKVLSGTLYGKTPSGDPKFQGCLDPADYAHDYARLKQQSIDSKTI